MSLGHLPSLCLPHPTGLPRVFCIHVWLCTDRLACGINRAAALTMGLAGPKICTTFTSHTTLRKNLTIQNFLNTSILENTYVTQSRQSIFVKQVSFWLEWVGIMKISAQVRQMFVLPPLGPGKLWEIFRAAELRWETCWRLCLTCPSSGFWRSVKACSAVPALAEVSLIYFPLFFTEAAVVL